MDRFLMFEGERNVGSRLSRGRPEDGEGLTYHPAPADWEADKNYRLADGEVVEVAAEAEPAEVAGESSAWKKVKSAIGI